MKIQKLLVPTDFSANAKKGVEYACAMAKAFSAKVILLHVTAPPFYQAGYGINPETIVQMQRDVETAITKQLGETRALLTDDSIEVETMVREGVPAFEVIEVAKESGADMIIMATHGHTGMKHFFLGSTAEKIVRTSPCPVLTVRADTP